MFYSVLPGYVFCYSYNLWIQFSHTVTFYLRFVSFSFLFNISYTPLTSSSFPLLYIHFLFPCLSFILFYHTFFVFHILRLIFWCFSFDSSFALSLFIHLCSLSRLIHSLSKLIPFLLPHLLIFSFTLIYFLLSSPSFTIPPFSPFPSFTIHFLPLIYSNLPFFPHFTALFPVFVFFFPHAPITSPH